MLTVPAKFAQNYDFFGYLIPFCTLELRQYKICYLGYITHD